MERENGQNPRGLRIPPNLTFGPSRRPPPTPYRILMQILLNVGPGRGPVPEQPANAQQQPPEALPMTERPGGSLRPREVRAVPRAHAHAMRRVPLLIPLRTEPLQPQPLRAANNPPQRLHPRRPVPISRRPQRRPPLLVPLIRRARPAQQMPLLAAVRPLNWPEFQAQLQPPQLLHPPPVPFLLGPGNIPPLWPELLHNVRPPAWPPPVAPWTALALLFMMIYDLPYDLPEGYRAVYGPPPAPNW